MTQLIKPVRRETNSFVQGRPLIVELGPHEIIVRRKGTRLRYTVPIEALWPLGAKIARREWEREHPKKGRGK